jgi:phosphatidate cytidylyltransferase
MSALILLPVYFFCVLTESFMQIPVLIVSIVITLSSLYEFYEIAKCKEKAKPFFAAGLLAGFLVNVIMYLYAFGKVIAFDKYIPLYDVRPVFAIVVILLASVMIYQIFKRPIEGGIFALSTTVFGLIYIVIFFSHIIFMKALPDGIFYIIALHIIVMINDTAAYFGGVLFGKHKAGFAVSPNKSWEGYFSGMLFSIIAMIVVNEVYITFYDKTLFTTLEAGLIGMALSILGNAGDLIESAIKRDAKVKDSGTIIPGHGGVWDVFDALIFTTPIFYYYLKIKGM